ncbi:MICOS complex subunit Mic10-like [Coccinella septempunctata]|uniref:MICOS complex subunit Mic10-like n=1 Tax=Coccinella septempunctata TaxID=41139 RepID=UPI001D0967DD|nr:MICOS complex subunit Mic10-like [Coccinella septempunctata]
MGIPIYVEDEIGKKWDRCITDGLLKFSSGLLIGGLFSVLFFKKKRWPLLMGSGFGVGMAYSNCEKDLNATVTAAEKCL